MSAPPATTPPAATAAGPSLDAAQARALYRTMRTIREFEQRCHELAAAQEIPGVVHLYTGQEAVAAGVVGLLRPDDHIASTHRGHGHAIAKGCELAAMMSELFGRADGLCGGKGGSMHIADFDRGMLGANGVAAGGVPMACGAALSAKVLRSDRIAVAFVGDGGANQGAFAESLNLAAVWQLPVVFVVEDNGFAQSTATAYHLRGVDVARRAEGFGMPGESVDGTDVLAVRAAFDAAARRARSGGGPTLLSCRAVRWHGHMEGWDPQRYRDPDELARTRDVDPIIRFLDHAQAAGLLTAADVAATDAAVRAEIDAAVDHARSAPEPDPTDLLSDVYVTYAGS